jgi:plasmid stability protein
MTFCSMADGEVRVVLDAETERRLRAAADAAGRSVDEYARALIVDGLDDDDWAIDERIADEAERAGTTYSVQEAMAHFRTELHARVKTSK